MISQRLKDEMTEEDLEKYELRVAIDKQVRLKAKKISSKYNPKIKKLKEVRDAEYAEIYKWRDMIYEIKGL